MLTIMVGFQKYVGSVIVNLLVLLLIEIRELKMLNKVIFAQNFTMLAEIYDKPITKTLQSTYYFLLKDMQDDDFKQAVKRLLKERTFASMPKPAEILELTNIKEVIIYDNRDEIEARRLIDLVRGINEKVFMDSEKMSIPFSDLMNKISLKQMISESDLAILNTVKPHREAKLLISEINTYQDGEIQLQAFIDALKFTPSDAVQIASVTERLRIKR